MARLEIKYDFAQRVHVFFLRGLGNVSRVFLGEASVIPILYGDHGMIRRRQVLFQANGGNPAFYRRLVLESQLVQLCVVHNPKTRSSGPRTGIPTAAWRWEASAPRPAQDCG